MRPCVRKTKRSAIHRRRGVSYEGTRGLIMCYRSGGPVNHAVNAAGVSEEWHGNRLPLELLSREGRVSPSLVISVELEQTFTVILIFCQNRTQQILLSVDRGDVLVLKPNMYDS